MTTYGFAWSNGETYSLPELRRAVEALHEKYYEANNRFASIELKAGKQRDIFGNLREDIQYAQSAYTPLWRLVRVQGDTARIGEYNAAEKHYLGLLDVEREMLEYMKDIERKATRAKEEDDRAHALWKQAEADLIATIARAGPEEDNEEEPLPFYSRKAVRVNSDPVWERNPDPPSPRALENWWSYVLECFEDYPSITAFPEPPAWICGNAACEIEGRKCRPCKCNIRWCFECVQGATLEELAEDWEPEKFAVCKDPGRFDGGSARAVRYMEKAGEIHAVLMEMVTEKARRRARKARRARRARKMRIA